MKDKRKKKEDSRPDKPQKKTASDGQDAKSAKEPEEKDAEVVSNGEWEDMKRPARRAFPGPKDTEVPLRIAMEREAYAEAVAHAKESLDSEVCGVFVGSVFTDDVGPFVEVKSIIQGSSARQGTTHVTFTHETWNSIHETLQEEYPKLQIVGWYHSHPGFGVDFSEMDLFIQQNFFAGPTQFALVTDPLGGAVAVCCNTPDGITPVERFWVDGREHQCQVPKIEGEEDKPHEGSVSPKELETIQKRLTQLSQTLDEMRLNFYRFLMTIFFVIALGIVGAIGYTMYHAATSTMNPAELEGSTPILVQWGERTIMLTAGIRYWDVPPELVKSFLDRQIEEMKALRESLAAQESGAEDETAVQPSTDSGEQEGGG